MTRTPRKDGASEVGGERAKCGTAGGMGRARVAACAGSGGVRRVGVYRVVCRLDSALTNVPRCCRTVPASCSLCTPTPRSVQLRRTKQADILVEPSGRPRCGLEAVGCGPPHFGRPRQPRQLPAPVPHTAVTAQLPPPPWQHARCSLSTSAEHAPGTSACLVHRFLSCHL